MLTRNHRGRTNLADRLSNVIHSLPFVRRRQGATGVRTRPVSWAQTSWGQKFIKSTTLALVLVSLASIALADVKITTRSGAGGQTMTYTTYVKGARQRTEGMGFTTIYQCDLKRLIQINDKTRSYLITPIAGADGANNTPKSKTAGRKGGVVTYHTTYTDTGERKQMFGMTAKRIKSKMVVESSEGACNTMNMEMETDGWYVEIAGGMNCQNEAAQSYPSADSDCVDEVRFKTTGAANTGYPVMTTTSMKISTGADGPAIPASSSTQEVTDISNAKLDPSLFDVPAGYKEVKTMQELGSPY